MRREEGSGKRSFRSHTPDGKIKVVRTYRPETIAEFFARPKPLKACKPYSAHDKIQSLMLVIKTKSWFLYYLRVLLGQLPSHCGMATRDFATTDAKLTKEIDELIEERTALRSDFANGEKLIAILIRDLKVLEQRYGKHVLDSKQTYHEREKRERKIASFATIKERLGALEDELKSDDFDAEKLLAFYKEYKEAETKRKAIEKEERTNTNR